MATYEFGSYRDIGKYAKSTHGVDILTVGNKTIKQIYAEEQRRIRTILKEEVLKYYRSYTPTTYERTYDMIKAIKMSPVEMSKDGKSVSVSVYFDDKAYKPSVVSSKYEDGFTPILINNGWEWHDMLADAKEHFHWQKPFHFGEKTVKRYNSENPYGFKVDLIIEYTGTGLK